MKRKPDKFDRQAERLLRTCVKADLDEWTRSLAAALRRVDRAAHERGRRDAVKDALNVAFDENARIG